MERALRETLDGGAFHNVPPNVSKNMASIKSRRTKSTEIKFQQALTESGITDFQVNVKMPGSPDIYFLKYRVAVFLDGCFWHGCPRCGHIPKSNSKYWRAKIERTKIRDAQKRFALSEQGFKILQYWEHDLINNVAECVSLLNDALEERLTFLSAAID